MQISSSSTDTLAFYEIQYGRRLNYHLGFVGKLVGPPTNAHSWWQFFRGNTQDPTNKAETREEIYAYSACLQNKKLSYRKQIVRQLRIQYVDGINSIYVTLKSRPIIAVPNVTAHLAASIPITVLLYNECVSHSA